MSLNVIYEQKNQNLHIASSNREKKSKLQFLPHLHRELELVLYLGGETDAYADSVRYRLTAGDLFLTFPNQIHSYITYAPEEYIIIIVKPEIMPELIDVFNMAIPDSAVLHGAATDPVIRTLAERLIRFEQEKQNNQPYAKQLLHGYLLALFSEILSRMRIKRVSVGDSDTLRAIVSFCSRNFSANLSLSVLEENLHLNKYYISHLFSERLGLRFNDYVNSLRVSEACRYLLYSAHSITEISDIVGFNTMRTFNRAFLRQIGVTPSEYRRGNSETAVG
ncbi:MAG: AraC family transcriptional regulator [Clostridia bacterium]|nr:AraC family transcriptional regulator [Clostridia bacterium]MBQ3639971.1 AraC family transcriptional regulator [Clostridia bacterium]